MHSLARAILQTFKMNALDLLGLGSDKLWQHHPLLILPYFILTQVHIHNTQTHTHWWGYECASPARALMRERSKRRAELFSLSQSVSAARSQRLLMSLYCCWISKLSKSVGEMVLMVSKLRGNAFNLEAKEKRHIGPKSANGAKEVDMAQYQGLNTCWLIFRFFSAQELNIHLSTSGIRHCYNLTYFTHTLFWHQPYALTVLYFWYPESQMTGPCK